MKNFIFPQIFQTVLEGGNQLLLKQWNIALRKTQTQSEGSPQNFENHQFSRTFRPNFLLQFSKHSPQPSDFSVNNPTKRAQSRQKENKAICKTQWNQSNTSKDRSKFQKCQYKNVKLSNLETFNNHKQRSINKKYSRRAYVDLQGENFHNNFNQLNIIQNQLHQSKNKIHQTDENKIGKNLVRKRKSKGKKQLRTEKQNEKNSKLVNDDENKHRQKSHKSIKAMHNTQKSVDKKKSKQEGEQQMIKQGQLFEQDEKIEKQEDNTNDFNKLLQSTNPSNPSNITEMIAEKQKSNKSNNSHQADEVVKQRRIPQTKIRKRQIKKSATLHVFQNQTNNKQHKNTYTFKNFDEQDEKQSEAFKSQIPSVEKVKGDIKSNKKVQFKRISIEKSEKSIEDMKSSIKTKSSIQRALKNASKTSIRLISFTEIDNPYQRNQFMKDNKYIKKSFRNNKLNEQNAYNELNTFRLKLKNIKKSEFQSETYPQTIIRGYLLQIPLSVGRKQNKQEYEKIKRTVQINHMIDFGVKMSKDIMLKQRKML